MKFKASLRPPGPLRQETLYFTARVLRLKAQSGLQSAPPKIPVPPVPEGSNVDQAQLELQLKVWKDLAISKQILMRTATDALKLEPETTQEELKKALEAVIKKLAKADADVAAAQEQARQSVAVMERKLAVAVRAQAETQAANTDLLTKQENTATGLAAERIAAAKELQKFKDGLAEKEKQLKAINVALADTPENVLKKLNVLKKQRQEEADARRVIETTLNTLRADKKKQEAQTEEVKKSSGKLVQVYRHLHELALKLHEQLKPLAADAKDVPKVPDLDTDLIESIENPGAEKSKTKKK